MKAAAEKIPFAGGAHDRIKHVIYIIKENRTYDQVFGDLKQNGKPVGNGDPSLTMYGEDITPNLHKLALQFGVLDNFFDSGEVSGDGHVWSNAAIGSDYLEKTWQQCLPWRAALLRFRGRGRRRLSAAAEDSRRERTGQRISVGRSRRARQDLLPLRRIHFDHFLQRRRRGPHAFQSAGRADDARPSLRAQGNRAR